MNNIKVYRSEKEKDYYKKDLYLLECIDEDTYDKYDLGGIQIQIVTKYQKNGLHKFPVKGMIVQTNEESEFKKGEKVICKYDTFMNPSNSEKKVAIRRNGKEYYVAGNRNIICRANSDGTITPRRGILVCKPIHGKLVDTSMYVSGEMEGRRRDLVEVVQAFEGSRAKVGDFLLTNLGGDYEFYVGKELYLAVDEYFEDYYAIVGSKDWYDSEKVRIEIDLRNTIKF